MTEQKHPYWPGEDPQAFAEGFREESGSHPLPESVKAWQAARPAVEDYQAAHPLQEIEVECYEKTVLHGQRWRIHSFYDKESIALTDQGMRELLDTLLKIADQFSDQPPPREDETPETWSGPRTSPSD